jgi:major type 1 subunit fimbrin (pilin)
MIVRNAKLNLIYMGPYMKKIAVGSVALMLGMLSTQTFAATGSVAITGAIIDKGCDVVAGSDVLDVDLGVVDASAFEGTVGNTLGSAPVKIVLNNCPAEITGVGVAFDGPTNSENTDLLAVQSVDGATGVGVAFYESDSSTLVPLHKQSAFNELAEGQTNIALNYVAKYMATSETVVGGNASAVANFTLVYN